MSFIFVFALLLSCVFEDIERCHKYMYCYYCMDDSTVMDSVNLKGVND